MLDLVSKTHSSRLKQHILTYQVIQVRGFLIAPPVVVRIPVDVWLVEKVDCTENLRPSLVRARPMVIAYLICPRIDAPIVGRVVGFKEIGEGHAEPSL